MQNTLSRIAIMSIIIGAAVSIAFLDERGQLRQAYAVNITISGKVTTSSGQAVVGTKIYFEAPATTGTPVAAFTTTASDGTYSLSLPSGYTYTVDASHYGFNRARYPSTISTTTSNVNFVINPQNAAGLNLFITGDEEFRAAFGSGWKTTAWSKITAYRQDWRDQWNIEMLDTYYSTDANNDHWVSPNGVTSCSTLHTDLRSDTGWSSGQYHSADVLFAFTEQSLTSGDTIAGGCVNDIPSSGGTHPSVILKDGSETAISHEFGHTYGFAHHVVSYYCMMNTGSWPDITGMEPGYDNTMALQASPRRTWY